VVEKWSRYNAFDPDSDEFFDSEDAVYEAFLTEEEIAERERQAASEEAQLVADSVVRYENGTGPNPTAAPTRASANATTDSLVHSGDPGGIEFYFMGNPTPEMAQTQRTNQTEVGSESSVPRINVSSPESLGNEMIRSPSPDPLNIISGVTHLSESPRPMVPQELPSSPVPNTPARVSGVFERLTPNPGTPHILNLYDHHLPPWVVSNRSPGSGPRYRVSPVPAPLTS